MYTRILRFAPSPNGFLHLGHAYSALLNSDMAREFGGRLLLRIEDIDGGRCRPEFEAAIYDDLRWLGIAWREPVRRQSEHFDDYRAAIAKLQAQGLLYPSFESRSEIDALVAERDRLGGWPRDPDGVPIYPGRARKMPAAERARRLESGAPLRAASGDGRSGGACRRAALDRDRLRAATGRPVRSRRRRSAGATSCWRARTCRPAITSPPRSTTPCRASATWCAARTCSGRPASTACCRRCSASRSRATIIIGSFSTAAGRKLSKSTEADKPARHARRRRHRPGYQAHGRTWPLNVRRS